MSQQLNAPINALSQPDGHHLGNTSPSNLNIADLSIEDYDGEVKHPVSSAASHHHINSGSSASVPSARGPHPASQHINRQRSPQKAIINIRNSPINNNNNNNNNSPINPSPAAAQQQDPNNVVPQHKCHGCQTTEILDADVEVCPTCNVMVCIVCRNADPPVACDCPDAVVDDSSSIDAELASRADRLELMARVYVNQADRLNLTFSTPEYLRLRGELLDAITNGNERAAQDLRARIDLSDKHYNIKTQLTLIKQQQDQRKKRRLQRLRLAERSLKIADQCRVPSSLLKPGTPHTLQSVREQRQALEQEIQDNKRKRSEDLEDSDDADPDWQPRPAKKYKQHRDKNQKRPRLGNAQDQAPTASVSVSASYPTEEDNTMNQDS